MHRQLQMMVLGAKPWCLMLRFHATNVSQSGQRPESSRISVFFLDLLETPFAETVESPKNVKITNANTMLSSLSFLESRAIPTNYTQAFSLTPSGNWDGNDGAWSTFMIRVGTPAQFFRVLPSTSGTETWIPIPDNCNAGMSWCGNARGVEPFNGVEASPFSGTPSDITVSTVDAGVTCTANKSPM